MYLRLSGPFFRSCYFYILLYLMYVFFVSSGHFLSARNYYSFRPIELPDYTASTCRFSYWISLVVVLRPITVISVYDGWSIHIYYTYSWKTQKSLSERLNYCRLLLTAPRRLMTLRFMVYYSLDDIFIFLH